MLVRDSTARQTAWIEVGSPDAERLHYGSKLTGHVAIYTHRDPARVVPQWSGKKIHDAENIVLHSFDPGSCRASRKRSSDATPSHCR